MYFFRKIYGSFFVFKIYKYFIIIFESVGVRKKKVKLIKKNL